MNSHDSTVRELAKSLPRGPIALPDPARRDVLDELGWFESNHDALPPPPAAATTTAATDTRKLNAPTRATFPEDRAVIRKPIGASNTMESRWLQSVSGKILHCLLFVLFL